MYLAHVLQDIPYSAFAESLVIILVTGGIVLLVRYLFAYLRDKTHPKSWLRLLGESLYTPAQWLAAGYGLIYLIESLILHYGILRQSVDLDKVRSLYFTVGFFWLLYIWEQHIIYSLSEKAKRSRKKRDEQALILALGRLATIAIVIIAGLSILTALDVPITGLLAFGGVGGLALSFAGSDVIKNLFGGLMIFMNRHFSEGDWIRSPNKNFEGVVEKIGWYLTRIRTFERRPTFIPNALMTDAIIENPSRMYNRRIMKTVGIRYDDFHVVKQIVDEIRDMLQKHEHIDQKQYLMVEFQEYGPYSLNIDIYTFTRTTDWQEWRQVQQDVLIRVGKIIEKHGASIAFPTNTVHLHQD